MVDRVTYDDHELTRRLFDFLEDRRVLYAPQHTKILVLAQRSVMEARDYLTDILDKDKPGEYLAHSIRSMRGACRRFMDNVDEFRRANPDHPDRFEDSAEWEVLGAVGELRARLGDQIFLLSKHFGLDVPGDLRSVLPPDPE